MGRTIRIVLAVVLGMAAGSAVNMGLVLLGPMVIPPPPGVDVTDMESLSSSMHLFQFRHFVFPFLAHAAGTLAAAYLAVKIASGYRLKLSMLIGSLFLLGGIANAMMLPAPGWFIAADLIGAYLPMAWIGGQLAARD
ncbi:MAG: hypothetical protein OXH56_14075 [Gemmatimonadetes bacterium]|nr:hypothetical protein [Gemmatimonadota bacterium]